jgi:hypothetical protein
MDRRNDEGATRHRATAAWPWPPGTIVCMALPPDDRRPLARLLGMVGSNRPHEALAAAKLADKLIKQRNATRFDVVGAGAPEPEADSGDDRRFAAYGGWRQAARLGASHGDDILSAWERRPCPTNSWRSSRTALGSWRLPGWLHKRRH